jgi:redox-sensing transcriptional repressor
VKKPLPGVAVPRLTLYLRCLDDLGSAAGRISSVDLAVRAGVSAAKVRKDLSYLGSYGVRGVGYEVEHLRFQIRRELGLTHEWPMVLVGAGNLGRALAGYEGFKEHGFRMVGVFDSDPSRVGVRFDGLVVEPLERLAAVVRERRSCIGVIATRAESAQMAADFLVEAGVCSILDFAPAVVRVPPHVQVRRVDFSNELQVLAFHMHQREAEAE